MSCNVLNYVLLEMTRRAGPRANGLNFDGPKWQPGLPEGHRSANPTRYARMIRPRFKLVVEFVYRRRHVLRIAGLALLMAGLGVAIGLDAVAGFALIGAAALLLACAQPLLLAHLRYRQARRQAPNNGHGPRVDDFDSF
jgi:hypothetical protein